MPKIKLLYFLSFGSASSSNVSPTIEILISINGYIVSKGNRIFLYDLFSYHRCIGWKQDQSMHNFNVILHRSLAITGIVWDFKMVVEFHLDVDHKVCITDFCKCMLYRYSTKWITIRAQTPNERSLIQVLISLTYLDLVPSDSISYLCYLYQNVEMDPL